MAIIIDKESKEYYIKAGKIAGKALNYGSKLVKIGMPVRELLDKVEDKIKDLGGGLAFPAQASLNSFAAHQCPSDNELVFKEEDMIKLDFGAEYEGFIGDNARTVYLGNNKEMIKLVQASKNALLAVSKIVKEGTTLGELGRVIETTIKNDGFEPIRNLSGHGIGVYAQHDDPSIPNFDNGDNVMLEENEMIAIEPFATNGAGLVKDSGEATLFQKVSNKNTRNPFARDALKEIETLEGLPFSYSFLQKRIGTGKTRVALRELKHLEILREFAPLTEKSGGMVSQHEHSFLVQKGKSIITTLVDDD